MFSPASGFEARTKITPDVPEVENVRALSY